jgi:dTDP-4-amino-4,6-dideoxygalactose transaminase
MEIGSEFWISKVPEETSKIPTWIEKYGETILTSSGRGAITLLLGQIKPKFKTVLLPAYICETIIQPFKANGYTCCFYDINKDLTASFDDNKIHGDIGIFFHMGYFGFPTNSSLVNVIKELKENGSIIIEDITQSLFSDYKRNDYNDYYIASLRKWSGIPSGGILASAQKSIKGILHNNMTFAEIRRKALLLKADYINKMDNSLKPKFQELFQKAESILDCDLSSYNIDDLSLAIISNLDIKGLREKRINNFNVLSNGLDNIDYLTPVFKKIPENVCPLFYPVYINSDRGNIRQYLIGKNIYCPIHWPKPNEIDYEHYINANKIYCTELSIPCDQRYETIDMERIILTLNAYSI